MTMGGLGACIDTDTNTSIAFEKPRQRWLDSTFAFRAGFTQSLSSRRAIALEE